MSAEIQLDVEGLGDHLLLQTMTGSDHNGILPFVPSDIHTGSRGRVIRGSSRLWRSFCVSMYISSSENGIWPRKLTHASIRYTKADLGNTTIGPSAVQEGLLTMCRILGSSAALKAPNYIGNADKRIA